MASKIAEITERLRDKAMDETIKETNKNWTKKPLLKFDLVQFEFLIIKWAEYVQAKKNLEVGYILDQYNKPVIKKLWEWLSEERESTISFRKGFYIYGRYGCGKSVLMEAFINMLDEYANIYNSYIHTFITSENLHAGLLKNKTYASIICIDELGKEPKEIKDYGTDKTPVISHLVERHRIGKITHATSNIALSDLTGIYGTYVVERFIEMFNFIEMEGTSKRK